MILSLLRKRGPSEEVHAVYSAIVAQSRQPVPYADWNVPDTVTGRFDMISLHMALVLRRLRRAPAASGFSQDLFDLFFKDMDRSLREMGVTDMGVPKKIEKMGTLFYGLLAALADALDREDEEALAGVIARNVYAGEPDADPAPLARYTIRLADWLATQSADAILAGEVSMEPQP